MGLGELVGGGGFAGTDRTFGGVLAGASGGKDGSGSRDATGIVNYFTPGLVTTGFLIGATERKKAKIALKSDSSILETSSHGITV